MIRKLIAKYSKNILTPALTSLFLLAITLMDAPELFNYSASFLAEGVILLSLYYLAVREHSRTKIDLENKERVLSETLDLEISNTANLISSVAGDNIEAKEQASKFLGELMAQKAEVTQKRLKKQKDEIEAAQIRYESSIRERQESQADIEKVIDDSIKASIDNFK